MITGIFLGVGIAVFLIGLFLFFQRKQQPNREKLFEQNAHQALGVMVQEIIKTARDQLSAEKKDITETVAKDLKQQAATFTEISQSLKQEIAERQREIRQFEEDRNRKYGQIAQALTDYKSLTEELRGSTEQLKRVLASNQLRGSWGEIQAEKILEAAGMIHGQHYAKQQSINDHTELRPDFTLFLPNKMELYVDVKFPLNALQQAFASKTKDDYNRYLQEFGNDLKLRLKEVGKYIIGRPTSLDYVILFVPSESVFEIINKNFPGIVDSSFSQRVILASPHSFFAVVRTIQESYTHFYYGQNIKEILKHMQGLLGHFEKFKGEFHDVGRALLSAQTKYDQIAQTRVKLITNTTEKINTYQISQGDQPLELPPNSQKENDLN